MKNTGLKVIVKNGFLNLTDDKGNNIGCQTDIKIKNSVEDNEIIHVTTTFTMSVDDIIAE